MIELNFIIPSILCVELCAWGSVGFSCAAPNFPPCKGRHTTRFCHARISLSPLNFPLLPLRPSRGGRSKVWKKRDINIRFSFDRLYNPWQSWKLGMEILSTERECSKGEDTVSFEKCRRERGGGTIVKWNSATIQHTHKNFEWKWNWIRSGGARACNMELHGWRNVSRTHMGCRKEEDSERLGRWRWGGFR